MINSYLLENISLYSDSITLETVDDNTINNYSVIISDKDYTLNISDAHSTNNLNISLNEEVLIPLSILKNNSSLEAIVFYLKEILNLTYIKIATVLNRDQRTIWATYNNSKKKKILLDLNNNSEIFVPLSIFISRNFSIFESIVFYLKITHMLSFKQISHLLGKNYRTIWTIYSRAIKKYDLKSTVKNVSVDYRRDIK
ncbi:MAG: hypothetical protein ACP5N1_04075 [Candidatus Woesearchaeota archaeon]